jgi:ribosomal protein S12 methylthiotransferase
LKSFHVITLGCPKNQVDSEILAGVCLGAGLRFRKDPGRADLLVLNTCAFIEPAVEESLEKLGELLDWKASGENRHVVLAGCLPGRFADDGSGGLEEIDLVIGPGEHQRLAHWLGATGQLSRQIGSGVYRYVKIAEGCSNKCSYCTIPAIRGGFRAVDASDVVDSVNSVVGQGAREVGLVAQDSGAHPELTGIIDRVTNLHPGVWFRLYYVHPAHFPKDLPGLLESRPNLAPYLDLPIQHASAPVLERMGRGYGPDRLSRIMDTIEGLSRPVAVRFTVITGYPGETDRDFRCLERFLGGYPSIRHIAAFPWWPEEGTPEYERAARQGDAVPEHVTMERLSVLSSLGEGIYHSWTERLTGQRFPVMADTSLTGHGFYDAPEADLQATFIRPVVPGSVVMCSLVGTSSSEMVVDKAE